MKYKILILLLIGIILISGCVRQTAEINSFDDCANAGYPILESYPRQCKTPDGRTFTEKLTPEEESNEYYGTSTFGDCKNNDCYISGCNTEICQSKAEEPLASICIVPDKPTPKQLDYECKCLDNKCQWVK